MSGSSYSLLTKEDTSDEEKEVHFVHNMGHHVRRSELNIGMKTTFSRIKFQEKLDITFATFY